MELTKSERESFWDSGTYVFVTDHTKPAMKWAISELKNRGKKVYVIHLSENPESGSLSNVSELPPGIDRAVMGITKSEPGDLIPALKKKGISKIWLHWKTETEKALAACAAENVECMTEHCPMMYLGSGFSIHGIHRGIAKLTGKY
jgi:hypothetical protein